MELRTPILALASLIAILLASQDQKAPAPPLIDGRYLRAYDVAAKKIEDWKGLPKRWKDRESYAVEFEGETNGCYVLHFLPKGDVPKVPATDFDKDTGYPLRISIRKSDLKYVSAFVE